LAHPNGAAAGPAPARLAPRAGSRGPTHAQVALLLGTAAVGAPPPAQPSPSPGASSRGCCHHNGITTWRAQRSPRPIPFLLPACAADLTSLRRAGTGINSATVQTRASTSLRLANTQTRAGTCVHSAEIRTGAPPSIHPAVKHTIIGQYSKACGKKTGHKSV
jgi:hypothetical protein